MLKVVDGKEFITPNQWEIIIENADLPTLNYLEEEGFETIKYFTRNDWMDTRTNLDLQDKVHSRISQISNDKWFNRNF